MNFSKKSCYFHGKDSTILEQFLVNPRTKLYVTSRILVRLSYEDASLQTRDTPPKDLGHFGSYGRSAPAMSYHVTLEMFYVSS